MSDFELSDSYHQFFNKALGSNYLYGVSWSGHSQIPAETKHDCHHYVAVISDDMAFETIRQEVVEHNASSQMTLYCIHQENFERFLTLNPSFTDRLNQYGWCSSREVFQGNKLETDCSDSGWIAWQIMQATADLYYDQSNNLRLRSLLPLNKESDFSKNQDALKQLLAQSKVEEESSREESPTVDNPSPPPFDFPQPIAVYLKLDQLILVTQDPAAALHISGDKAITDWMNQRAATAVQVCTPMQLRQAVETEDLVTARLMSYQHIWGANILKQVHYGKNELLIGAAKVAAYWQFYGISKLLFEAPITVEKDRKTIHDLQNRLLNIRLQNELFSRFGYTTKGVPNIDIPDQSAPTSLRLQVIQDLFAWWTNFYLDQINAE